MSSFHLLFVGEGRDSCSAEVLPSMFKFIKHLPNSHYRRINHLHCSICVKPPPPQKKVEILSRANENDDLGHSSLSRFNIQYDLFSN